MHLYLDYQDGQWPEVQTVLFSPGTHDWEERCIRVEPSRPVKTAMVLLEFHQPEGAAWFDDLALTSGNRNDRNLLAASGFEEHDPTAVEAQAMSAEYEKEVQTLLESLEAAAKSASPAETFPALVTTINTLATLLNGKDQGAYFPRELRDLDDARKTIGLCDGLLAAGE